MIKDYPGVVGTENSMRLEKDGTLKRVARVTVDRATSEDDPDFDQAWFDGLMDELRQLAHSQVWDSIDVLRLRTRDGA